MDARVGLGGFGWPGRRAQSAVRAIFDTAYYLRRYPDVAEAGVDPLAHFLGFGWAEGRNPCALFDTELYLERNGDVAQAGLNPLVHYVKCGAREGRRVSLLFDADWYLAKNPDIAEAARANPLAHYLAQGAAEGREANPLFDQAWYLKRYPGALAEAPCALAHYAERGLSERLSPHPLFDGAFYLGRYPDVARAGMNPLAHFLLRGHEEVRDPHPLFDSAWYLKQYPDVAAARMNPLLHYVWEGAKEGRDPNRDGVRDGPLLKGAPRVAKNRAQRARLEEASVPFEALLAAREIARQSDAVAIVCWDGAHNPIGRAKVLYDTLAGRRPVVLFSYLFPEFGGSLWAPLQSAEMNYIGIPWGERDSCHRLLRDLDVRFDTIWICKPRLPSFLLAEKICHARTRLILDIDDNEEHFARSQGSQNKPYGLPSIGLSRRCMDRIKARTVASRTLKADFGGELVRHARSPCERARTASTAGLKIGFLGTVRPHKNILGAARAIKQFAENSVLKPVFHVHGDVAPPELKAALTAAGAVVHGNVPIAEAQTVIRECAAMITGFPSSAADEPITKYQITAKLGDSLAAGRPVLVPDTPSVRDLEGVNGIYLFNEASFSSALGRALKHASPIALPEEFTFEAAARAFAAAEKASQDAPRAGEVFAELPVGTNTSTGVRTRECVVLIWKQHDAGVYGRRIDQIARSYARARPDARVIVLELMHSSSLSFYDNNASDWTSDFAHISQLARRKAEGGFRDADGVDYRTLFFQTDQDLSRSFTEFLGRERLTPQNTAFIAFPIIRGAEAILGILRSFPLIVDFVDNQFAWASANDRVAYVSQYKSLAAAARQLVFNSERNSAFFRTEGIVPDGANVMIIPNWYQLPKSLIGAPMPAKSRQPSVVYTGNMNDRIDWSLIRAVADAGVDVNLVGNAHRAGPEFWDLLEHPGVVYHGPLKECDALSVSATCHLAIMPHTRDAFSDFMNPLKLHMYAAIGLPVVSTDVEGLLEHELIHVASDHAEFVASIRRRLENSKVSFPAGLLGNENVQPQALEYVALVASSRLHGDAEQAKRVALGTRSSEDDTTKYAAPTNTSTQQPAVDTTPVTRVPVAVNSKETMLGRSFWAPAPEADAASAFYEFGDLHPLSDFDRAYHQIAGSDRWLRPATMSGVILQKLKSKTPASFIRISDGEGDIFALAHAFGARLPLVDYAVRQISYIHFGELGVIDRDRPFFAKFITDAADAADVIGISAFSTVKNDFQTPDDKKDVRAIFGKRIAILSARQLFCKRPELRFADVWYSRYLLQNYGEILRAAKRICVISTYAELPGRLANAFNLNREAVQFIPVPKQAVFLKHNERKDTRHFPEGMEAIVSAIPHSDGETLVIVAGGLLGKHYCTIAKARGCIALDVGSVAEVWMGIKARDFSDEFLTKWCLPEVSAETPKEGIADPPKFAPGPKPSPKAEIVCHPETKASPMKASSLVEWLRTERPKLRVPPGDVGRLYALHIDYAASGCDVILDDGEYLINQTIKIPSNTTIIGRGSDRTTLTLQPNSNCHVFTNADYKEGNKNIYCSQFRVIGNGDAQAKPESQKGLTFACAFYLRAARSVMCTDLAFYDVRQTALHFSQCRNVAVKKVAARKLGWSGVSSSEASNIWVEATDVIDAGRDIMHSAIHLDGGTGVYVDANVSETTGNGIMLDSTFAPLRNCVIKGAARTCKRGISLSGSSNHPLESVVISCEAADNREVGILVSNSAYISIVNSRVVNNGQYGILFQGRNGGNNGVVVDTHVEGHETDIGEIHASHSNWIFSDPMAEEKHSTPRMNLQHLNRRFGKAEEWFS